MMSQAADVATIVGAGYGALQALCQFVMLFAPKNTVVFKFAKWLVSGPARDPVT